MLKWVFERVVGTGEAIETAVGYLPAPGALDVMGLAVTAEDLAEITSVDANGWRAAIPQIEAHFAQFGDRLPPELKAQLEQLDKRLASA